MVAALLAAGASPDVRDSDDALTPLMIAARQGDADAVRQLLAAGADVDARDELERTALLWACGRGTGRYDLESIRLLLEAGADPLARCATGQTVTQYARVDPELRALVDRADVGVLRKRTGTAGTSNRGRRRAGRRRSRPCDR